MTRRLKVLCLVLSFFGFVNIAFGAVPKEYEPNYKIKTNWDNVLADMVKIDAYKQTGTDIPTAIFSNLNKNFNQIFSHFPQTANNKVIYEQCLITTKNLSSKYQYDKFLVFRDRCFEPINKIMKEIDNKYKVEADIKVNPQSWSAPLTVTFDARWSIDPSNDTIPEKNYFWYFKDNSWIERTIWKWPVINYKFTDAGTYIVHLTVRSVNAENKWIFDWEASVNISVWPKAAVVSVYVNGKKLTESYTVKVWTQEAAKGVTIDGSGSYPTWGRRILSHEWEIIWWDSFSYKKSLKWNPWAINLRLPSKWEYNVALKMLDNESNVISSSYKLIVSDPIATIKFTPEQWTTSNLYWFDASLSYSVESRIKTFKWTIFDPDWNNMDGFESKNFQKTFPKPGNYTVKLTVLDELWNTNDDQVKFYVESTPPVPQFKITPVLNREYPSEFILDAGASYDNDVMSNNDSLEYEWKFSNEWVVKIEKSYEKWKKILVAFEDKWDFKVKLIVKDRYWKVSEIEKEIKVESALRPKLTVNPTASIWGNTTYFNISSNKSIAFYEWDFWDGTTSQSRTSNTSHQYQKVWAYNIKIKAQTTWWDSNTVYWNVFVGQKGYPIAAYEISNWNDSISNPNEICVEKWDNWTLDHQAYSIYRNQSFVIDTANSFNSKWEKWNLNIYFKPLNDETYNTPNLTYKFNEIGCSYVDLYVEDKIINKTDISRIWFKVKNAQPTINNILLAFPQFWNESWIWINQNKAQDIFQSDFDPLITKVTANWYADPDWYISYYQWYYYKTDDPSRLLEVKITPAAVPYTFFAVPKVPWEFTFWVKIVDNDWWETKSEDIIWKGPVLFFPPNASNPDIPIVTLKTKPINAKVWEEVTFTVISKILSPRSDFKANRIIKIDFDGDWKYDLTTKKESITYIYQKPWKYKPVAKVIYRWYAGIAHWESIEVTKWLKTSVLTDTYWKEVLIRDVSYGEIDLKEYCMQLGQCSKSKDFVIENKDYFDYSYESYGKKFMKLTINDKYWNQAISPVTLELKESQNNEKIHLMSIPNVSVESGTNVIQVWITLNNSVLFKVLNWGTWACYIDYDISKDSDWDWNPEWDKQWECNSVKMYNYDSDIRSTFARIYYASWTTTQSKDIKISFIDNDAGIPKEYETSYNNIEEILSSLQENNKEAVTFLKTLLVNLKNSLWDKSQMDSVILQLQDWLDNNPWVIDSDNTEKIQKIIDKLSDKSVKAALWWTEYDIAKADILIFIPDDKKEEVKSIFYEIENANNDQTKIKNLLQKILDIAVELKKQWVIDETDLNIIKWDSCKIMKYYGIPSDKCGDSTKAKATTSSSGILGTILKIVWIIAGILVFVFIVLTVIFAIKAKKQQNSDESNEEPNQ